MKYQVIAAAGAALSPLAVAVPYQQPHLRHAHLHQEKRDVQTQVDWEYVTEVVTVTAGAAQQHWQSHSHPWHKSSSTTSTAEPSSATSVASPSTEPAPTTSSDASPATSTEPAPTTSSEVEPTTSVATTSSASSVWSSSASSSTIASSSSSTADPTYAAPTSSTIEAKAPSSGTSSSSSSSTPITKNNLTPNGRKAGLSGYPGIQEKEAFTQLADYISWYSDYTPNTPDANGTDINTKGVKGIPMLWGADGSACGDVTPNRLSTFKNLVSDDVPEIMFGFFEPDCSCDMSSDMTPSAGTAQWNSLLHPLAKKGTILGSPSMCAQMNETWLQPFIKGGLESEWDVTSVHINKNNIEGVKGDIEYYLKTYKKPIWVSEFACVDDSNGHFIACTDQDEINGFINDAVQYFHHNESVVAFGPSNGDGLGTVWPLTDQDGNLSTSGQTYLNAIKDLYAETD